jgi:hypothetical protein
VAVTSSPILLLVAVLMLAPVQRLAAQDWNPSEKVPELSIVGAVTNAERAQAGEVRRAIIENIAYWKNAGLPEPKPISRVLYVSDLEKLSLREALQAFNPDISDITAQVDRDFDYFKRTRFYQAAQGDGIRNEIFDDYVSGRYGIAAKNVIARLRQEDVKGNFGGASFKPNKKDQKAHIAFFQGMASFRIQDRYPEARPGEDPAKWTPLDLFTAITPEIASTICISTASLPDGSRPQLAEDTSIWLHELGHHLHSSALGERQVPRLIKEVIADYLSAAQRDNPKIGAFFAEELGKIETSGPSKSLSAMQKEVVDMANTLSQKKFLRDLSEFSTLDTLNRFDLQGEHQAGDPARSFLWRLRESQKSDPQALARFDRLAVHSFQAFSSIPSPISPHGDLMIQLSSLNAGLIRILRSAATVAGIFLREGFPSEGLFSKAHRLTLEYYSAKARASGLAATPATGKLAKRARRAADAHLPEFFRCFYRAAKAEHPALADLVRQEAGIAMNSHTAITKTRLGTEELVFTRVAESELTNETKAKLRERLSAAEEARLSTSVEASAKGGLIQQRYSHAIEGVTEFERTAEAGKLKLKVFRPKAPKRTKLKSLR